MPPAKKPTNSTEDQGSSVPPLAPETVAAPEAVAAPETAITAVAPKVPTAGSLVKAAAGHPSLGARNERRIRIATEMYCAMLQGNNGYAGVPNQPWVLAAYRHADLLLAYGEANPIKE